MRNIAIVAATLSAAMVSATGLSNAVAAELSPKSTELVDHRCVGELAEDDLTLFAGALPVTDASSAKSSGRLRPVATG